MHGNSGSARVEVQSVTGEMANMVVLGLIVGIVVLVSIILMAIVGGSHVFD